MNKKAMNNNYTTGKRIHYNTSNNGDKCIEKFGETAVHVLSGT